MGNACGCCRHDVENNNQQNPQVNRFAVLLGPMLGGSFPASVAICNLIWKSPDVVKLFVFGGVALGVFAVASGLAATSLRNTPGTAVYARFATLAAITIVLGLFTGGLCTLFMSLPYQISCGVVGGALTVGLVDSWFMLKWLVRF